MHIEKNVCHRIIVTLLNIPGKIKDTLASCIDLQEMGVKKELHPIAGEKRTYLSHSYYTLTKEKKHQFFETLANLKVLDGYSSNIRNLVSVKEL